MSKQNAVDRQVRSEGASRSGVRWGLGATCLLFLAVLCAPAAGADEPPPAEAIEPPLELFSELEAVETTELEEARGGERTVLNLEEMAGQVSGNSIQGTVTTGASIVSGEAFQDLSGVSSVIINSGNNVSIQSSTTVNIVID